MGQTKEKEDDRVEDFEAVFNAILERINRQIKDKPKLRKEMADVLLNDQIGHVVFLNKHKVKACEEYAKDYPNDRAVFL